MALVEISAFDTGGKKISTTKVLQSRLGLGLADAKAITDRVLQGEVVTLTVLTVAQARDLVADLAALGVAAAVTDPDAAT